MLWRDTPGARGSHAGQAKDSQHTAWRGKGQILETSLPQADRPGADPCLSTTGWMALLGPSQDVQENRGPPACSACVSENSPSLFFRQQSISLYIQTFFYQEGSNRGTLIIFPLQLFSLTLSYLYVLVSDRDPERLGGKKKKAACMHQALLAAGWHNPQILPKAVCNAVPRDGARSKTFPQKVFLKRKRGGGAHPLHHL